MSIFDSPKFKPMDRVAGKASISVTKNSVSFSKQAISKLGYPHFVQIFINKTDGVIGIRACKSDDSNSIKFVNSKKTKVDSIRWSNPEFVSELNSMIVSKDLNDGLTILGEFLEDENALLFDFKKASQNQ